MVFFEKQEGSLCAQHALNALLQAPYFTAVDLAQIAEKLDTAEQMTMAEGGTDTIGFAQFMQRGSINMDDSGFFSVQVISKALEVWNLKLISLNSEDARMAKQHPSLQNAFICHLDQHWFTIRKIGAQWYNLNSMLSQPEPISDTYMSLMLAQLEAERYTIFVVEGDIPEPAASFTDGTYEDASQFGDCADDDLAAAIAMSLEPATPTGTEHQQQQQQQNNTPAVVELTPEEIRRKRLERFNNN